MTGQERPSLGCVAADGVVPELFDPSAWRPVEGFEFDDVTYHRAVDQGTVRVAIDRPEVRNAFRPQTVDELVVRSTTPAAALMSAASS